MKKTDLSIWASVAEILSAIAIVISLLYVGYELNRNTEVVNSDRSNEALVAFRSWEQILVTDHDVADLYLRGPNEYDEFSDIERLKYRIFIGQFTGIWEQLYNAHIAGLMQTEKWEDWNSSMLPDLPHVARVWPEISVYYNTGFRNHVETELSEHINEARVPD